MTKIVSGKALAAVHIENMNKASNADRHYPGRHRVEVLLNGRATALGEFVLLKTGR